MAGQNPAQSVTRAKVEPIWKVKHTVIIGQSAAVRRWRVYCSQFASCRWAGYRQGTAESVVEKPCPKCGRAVTR